MTPIAVPIFIRQGSDFPAEIRAAVAALQGAEGMLELRCDQAPAGMIAQTLDFIAEIRPATQPLPTILTIRPTSEGGLCPAPDAVRAQTFAAILAANAPHPAYIDIECEAWTREHSFKDLLAPFLRRTGVKLILSNHCFAGRPADLPARLAALRAHPEAHILKIAWKAASILDAVEALRLTRELPADDPRPVLALAMGEFGQISRLLACKFNAPFTFASRARDKESAPGQPTVAELRTLYRWHRQAADTPVCAVIGWPVGHSLSPHIHNAGFDALDLPGVYVPLPIAPAYEQFAAVVDALRNCPDMNLRGLSVTIPHKENALRYVRERRGTVDALSQQIGAINTLVWRSAEGLPEGFNTDYAGALDALVSAWTGRRTDLAAKRIVVLGAGGAARAIVAALAAHGADVAIYSLPHAQAEALAAEFNGKTGHVVALPWDQRRDAHADAWINTTPLGMYPKIDDSPIDFDPPWTRDTVAFDIVYNPLTTKFLRLAQAKNAQTVNGLEMFIRQAAVQFHHFTGREPPVDVFRQVALARLQAS